MLAETEDRAPPDAVSRPLAENKAAGPGLTYVSYDQPGIRRRRAGRGFVYMSPGGRVTDQAVLARIRALAIPPAWRDVWICDHADGHLQAIGFDARGRRQYRYHPEFRRAREGAKFEHLLTFAEALPALRERVAADMARPGLGREKVIATVVHLLETTMIRVGNTAYARDNKSYGLTTLRSRHVQVDGSALRFQFKGKSGKVWRLDIRDRRVARIVKACQDLPGQHLFAYQDGGGGQQTITSSDVNAYLKGATGRDITAKDFRTWNATVLTAEALSMAEAATRKALNAVIKDVASRLGNTPTVCRASYIHPQVIDAWMSGERLCAAAAVANGAPSTFSEAEAAVLDFLRRRSTTVDAGSCFDGDRDARSPR